MKKSVTMSLILLLFLLLFQLVTHATVPGQINYQGVLKDSSGKLFDGTKQMTFSIYSTPNGGNPQWDEMQTVTFEAGLYSVQLGSTPGNSIPPTIFDGNTLYLGVRVEPDPDEMKPRVPLITVPYAFRAGHADNIDGISAGSFVRLGPASTQETSADYGLNVKSTDIKGVGVKGESTNNIGVYGIGNRGVIGFMNAAGYAADYSGTYGILGGYYLLDPGGIYLFDERPAGVVGKSKDGHGVHGIASVSNKAGIFAENSGGGPAAIFDGNVEVAGSENQGVILSAEEDYPMITRGLDKFSVTSGKYKNLGRWGLFKESNALVLGIPNITDRKFVVARYYLDGQRFSLLTVGDDGVVDIYNKLKVNTAGIYGKNVGGDGIEGESTYSSGVYGHSSSLTYGSAGVKGVCDNGIAGVYGSSANGDGVRGVCTGTSGHGVVGFSGNFSPPYDSKNHYGGLFGSAEIGARGLGVFGSAYATVDFNGGEGLDIAEWVKVSDPSISAGDVVIIDKNNKKHILKSSSSYNTLVAGIISTAPNYLAGNLVENDEILDREEIKKRGYRMLALAGQVPCNVSTENGPIEIGDLLTTSNTPGHAMKVTDKMAAMGAIVGKALEPLAAGKGKIVVLVTLQ